ncbi:unnamed protein product [Bursaphelenchus okinawaensis]|uniref:Uncharacterized protein n=1 Tax=Bursaphelenchus okinawaensis TaxID=465554 RepID=A0A811L3T6_9BILA|nr:unnamed protein product [Bursaphelenchus okinawaensis]CAG9116793.1 unnamed protein product [Bursaphelenchus okinawaensis]
MLKPKNIKEKVPFPASKRQKRPALYITSQKSLVLTSKPQKSPVLAMSPQQPQFQAHRHTPQLTVLPARLQSQILVKSLASHRSSSQKQVRPDHCHLKRERLAYVLNEKCPAQLLRTYRWVE